jgi:hypothetical protein
LGMPSTGLRAALPHGRPVRQRRWGRDRTAMIDE